MNQFFTSKRRILLVVLLLAINVTITRAQSLSGTYSIPGSYTTIQDAVAALNQNGVSGAVTFNIGAGNFYTEVLTAPILLGSSVLNASVSATNTITFQKSGLALASPLITAFVGSKIASSTDSIDIMWAISGTDYVTIDGVDLFDPSTNTTNITTMEVGYGLYKRSVTDGINYVSIKNCVINLNRNNITNGAGPRANIAGATAIEVINCTRTLVGTAIIPTAVSGASSFNKFYGNTIQNCNIGIALAGGSVASPYTLADQSNDVGGNQASTGNFIKNFGGGSGAGNACAAVFVSNQYGSNISYNTVNNNDGGGANHPTSNRGIWLFANSPGASCTVNNNTITIFGGANTTAINWCVDMEMAQTGANGNVLSISNNQFLNCTSAPSTTAQFTAIWVNSAASTVNVNNNYIYGYSKNSTTGAATVILSQFAGIGTLNINNNIIDSISLTGIFTTQYVIGVTASTTTTNINNNTLTRMIFNSSTTGAGTWYPIFNSGASTTVNANGNVLDSLTRNGTIGGTTIGIYFSSGTNQNIRNNTIRNFYITGSGTTSTMYGIQLSGTTIVCDSNNIYNLNVAKTTGSGALYGIYDISSPTNENYRYNNIYNLTHIGTGIVYGLYAFTATGVRTVSYNNIYNLTGASTVTGILMSSSVPRIFNNRVYNLTTNNVGTTIVSAISISSTTAGTAQIFNNLISNIFAPNSNGTVATVIGINLTAATASTTIAVYHNTILLSAISSGANFSSAGIFHTANVTATTATLDLRNNIIVNTSVPNGSGRTAATRRSANVFNNYGTTSNRNLFYAGVPSNLSLIFFNGTVSDSTLADFQVRLGTFEQASVTQNPSFLSLIGSDPNFLHLDPSISTLCESGASVIATVPFDVDNVIRQGNVGYTGTGSAPDIGADEGEFTGISMVLDSSNVDQISAAVPINSTNQAVVALRVYTQNNFNALNLSSMKLNTSGTSSVADIQNARVYFTGNSPVFSASNQFGSTITAPNGTFYVNGSRTLSSGVNYFWVTYDTKPTSTPNNFIDVRVDSLVIGGLNTAPINGDPIGSRKILGPLNGNYLVGSTQTYSTVTAAVSDLGSLGVSGPVTFILTDTIYNAATGEVFPITIGSYTGASSTNTVTISPSIGNFARIESFNNVATLDLNGVNYLKIDGRPGATGGFMLGNNLIISNATTTAPAMRFINEASNNSILYTDLRANNLTATGVFGAGVVSFGTTTGFNGNDNNLIRYSHIHENAGGSPVVNISSIGSATSVATNNDNNIIDSCEVYNFYHPSIATAAVYLGANNGSWQINSNKFYQSNALNYTLAVTHRVLWITPNVANLTSASGFIIHHNFIGGNNASGTGSYTLTGTNGYLFNVMDISVGLGTPTSIQGNTISNVNVASTGGSAINFLGINLANGNVNCGTLTGNLIGSRSVNGAITYTSNGINGGAMGIRTGGGTGNTFNIANNIISGFDLYGNATSNAAEFFGINLFTGTNINVFNNMIGDTLLPNSIQLLSTSATSTFAQRVTGIFINPNAGTPVFNVYNNIICNFLNYYAATGAQAACTRGVALLPTIAGSYTVNNNRIFNLYTASNTTGGGVNSTLAGIAVNQTVGNAIITSNSISNINLIGSSMSGAITAVGIFYSTPSAGTNLVGRNNIHTINIAAMNPSAFISGMDIAAGNGVIQNNMIRLGIDSFGSAIQVPCVFRGITKNSGNLSIYFNSVYIGGSNISNSNANTFAFQRSGSGTDIVRNNIFVNNRSNANGSGKHYDVFLLNGTGLTLNNNDYFGTGTGFVFGSLNNGVSDVTAFQTGWLSTDNASTFANPQFINPNGTFLSGDLHIHPTQATPIEGGAVAISTITDDFDGQNRSSFSPSDMGADAGNFVQLDVFAPIIGNIAVSNTSSTGDRVFLANITDQTGIPISSGNDPKVYYKKFAAGSFTSSSAMRVFGNAQNGNYNFTISQAALSGLSLGDSIYFFLVAQDSSLSSNLGSLPGGVVASNVNTITSAPSALFSYRIVAGLGGTINVGVGQTFTSLTGVGGLFEAINNGSITSNVNAVITSDLLEDGTNGLNQINETGAGNYMFNIIPDGTTERLIAGNNAAGLIRLNGADRVKMDGRFNGSGRFLRIRNRVQTGHAITFLNDAKKDTVAYCHVESVNNSVGTILFSTSNVSGGTGNDSNVVTFCIVRDTLGSVTTSNVHNTGISSSGTAGLENDANVISNNEVVNFGFNAINLNAAGLGDNWKILNNAVYTNVPRANIFNVFQVSGGNGHVIDNNSIGGSAPNRSGAAFETTTATTPGFYGMNISVGSNSATQITNNTLSNISGGTRAVNAIHVTGGLVNIANNTIGGGAMPYDTIRNGYDNGTINITGGTVTVSNNTIGNIAYYGASGDRTSGITVSGGTVNINGNTIRDISGNASGTAFTFLITGIQLSGGINHVVENNQIYNIQNTNSSTSAYTVSGITVTSATNLLINRNRISRIWGNGTGTGANSNQVFGIYNAAIGNSTVRNNQVTLGQNTLGETRVYGVQDVSGSGNNYYYYNSILINGNVSSGSNNSYCIQRTGLANVVTFNNIFYNKRTINGTGANYASGSNSLTGVTPAVVNYNLYVVNDTTKLAEGPATFANSVSVYNTLYSNAGTYPSNWYVLASDLPASTFFTDTLVGNLNIVSSDANSWYANGKGLPLSGLNSDFNNALRSVSIASGATDLGSQEFTPSVIPALATASASPSANGTTTYTYGGRQIASITWGSAGTLPSSVALRYYSGSNAPNLLTGKTRYNAYFDVAATGGSGYSYNISLLADSSTLGDVSGLSNTKIAKYSTSWNLINTSATNGVLGTMFTTAAQTGFGIFTGTDGNNNPLPVTLSSFSARANEGDVLLNWVTASEKNNHGFYVERSLDGRIFTAIDFVAGKGNSNTAVSYNFKDVNSFVDAQTSQLYYRLRQVDLDGQETLSDIRLVQESKILSGFVEAFPNPFESGLTLNFNNNESGSAVIEVLDLNGKMVLSFAKDLEQGNSTIGVQEMNELSAGIYFLKVIRFHDIDVLKLVKR
ncbi:MAG: BNR-repeat neuraminidase N-terminal domain-containing protein [bacterium]|nr:BNR-repeat neuraminidase N-terminal domain-containing protein [bacterium]